MLILIVIAAWVIWGGWAAAETTGALMGGSEGVDDGNSSIDVLLRSLNLKTFRRLLEMVELDNILKSSRQLRTKSQKSFGIN